MSAQPAPMTFSLETQIAEVGSEIRKRRDVYPRLVLAGKMTAAEMDYKIECMLAVRASLRSLRGAPDVEDVDASARPRPPRAWRWSRPSATPSVIRAPSAAPRPPRSATAFQGDGILLSRSSTRSIKARPDGGRSGST